ncbi:bifunctional diguanylate cyclase/phosphodiesterase [Pseudomonas lundensis]|uniref:cyclic-guanylate-specific phosphodiesterase n=1 Tax=Pseudomonas lundensis TaxID=86185 RepID=A0AAX2H832_9PSED|nr:bifunctional diguanylate cyclase/phosphodiesterase [Pseudomonas lundensis]SOB52444.1 Sensory box/GGDEF domain/EAL domain protein [Pseudomonas lundensis]
MPTPADSVHLTSGLPSTEPLTLEQNGRQTPPLLAALKAAQLGAWCWDMESGDISWSEGSHALFGLPANRTLPGNLNQLSTLPFDDWPKAQLAFDAVLKNAPQERSTHHRIRWPDGTLHWLEIRGSRVPTADGKPRMMGVLQEVTQQRQRQQALNNSEERFATLFHLSPNMVLLVRLEDGLISEANHCFESLLGWPVQYAIGRTTLELGLWPDPQQRNAFIQAIRREQAPVDMEVQLRGRNGQLHGGILSAQKVELEGEEYLVSTFLDTSERIKAEQALKDSQERLDLALDSAQMGTWDWHIPSGQLYGSARAAQLHGLEAVAFNESFEAFFEGVPIEERYNMRNAYRSLREGPAGNYQLTYRVQLENGASRYLESRARLYRDDDGQPLRMAGTLLDITEQVEREQRLIASEEKFASVFQTSPDPICVLQAVSGEVMEINASFSQTFGWDMNDLRADPDHQATHLRPLLAAIQGPAQHNLTVSILHKNTDPLTCVVSSRSIELDGHACMVATLRDITQQQRAEAVLKASEEKFAKAFHSSPDAITISDYATGCYLEVNDGFTRLTGYTSAEVMGRSPYELGIWGDSSLRQALLDELEEKGRISNREILGRSRRGDLLNVEISIERITLNDTACLLLIARDISQLKAAQAQVRHLAYHDPLTNLPNRALLMDRLTQQSALLSRHDMRGALLFLDLDHFKHINDSLGHPVGDAVLKIITARLEASVRVEDTVARLGGDEFVVLLSGLHGSLEEVTRHVRATADTLRELLAEPMFLDGQRLQVTPSIGIALIPDHGANPADLFKRADIALYRAKDSGRNTTQLFHPDMQAAASERMRIESDLRTALARNEFSLHYQPQVDARTQRIVGAEALVRWQHPQLGPQSPSEFIKILEDSGLILEVGTWILDQACRDFGALLNDGLIQAKDFSLCVNISPRQFRQSNFVDRVQRSLLTHDLPSSMLKLEITEGIVIQNLEDTIAKMHQLTAMGVSFAMDDFGTGYSSLTHLKRLPVDTLKIDQSFVRDAINDPNDAEIIRAIVAMAHSLQLKVVAEGVERQQQLQFLQSLECHIYQGYLHSRPVPIDAFRTLLKA